MFIAKILFVLLSFSITAFADETAEKAAPVETSNPTPWVQAEAKVQELSARIETKKNQIEQLIIDKQLAKENSPAVKTIVDSLLREHKEYQRLVEDYEKNLNLLKYRFPERSAHNNRTYNKIEVRSLDDMEVEMGLDGKLTRNMQRMRRHYGTVAPSQNGDERSPASAGSQNKQKKYPDGSIENPTPIVIKK